MEIDVSLLKEEIETVNNLIKEYKNDFIQIQKVFSSLNTAWKGDLAKKYMVNAYVDNKKIEKKMIEALEVKEIYDYIVSQYENLGSKIKYNLNMKIKVFQNIDEYIEELKNVINLYKNIDYTNVDSNIMMMLEKQKNKFINMLEKLSEYRRLLNEVFLNIEKIESRIKTKLNNVVITSLN